MKKITKFMSLVLCVFALTTTSVLQAQECLNYQVFLADNPLSGDGSSSTLYSVDLTSGDAVMTKVLERNYRFHLAYNGVTNEVYLVKANGKGFEIVDPNNPSAEAVEENTTVFNIPGSTPTGVYYNGNLYIGAATSDTLWKYDFESGSLTQVSEEDAIPVGGGDLVVTGEKGGIPTFKLATRTKKSFWDLTPDGAGMYTASNQLEIPKSIMGMCVGSDGTILMANKGSQALNVFELASGAPTGEPIALTFGGESFTIRNGDMAAGCNIESNPDPKDCDDYQMYYADIRNGKTVISSFTLDASSGTATLGDEGYQFTKQMHIAIDPNGGIIYGKAEQGNSLTILDPSTGDSYDVELTGDEPLKSITTNTFHDGSLYLGSASQNRIVKVDLDTKKYVNYATKVPVAGGDIVFRGDDLILATRDGNQLLKVEAGDMQTSMINNLETSKVTGLALTVSGEYIASFEDQTTFQLLDSDGNFQKSFDVVDANGDSLTLKFGDLAAACVFPRIDEPPVGDCVDFRYYYADIRGNNTNVSSVSLAGTTANVAPLHTFSKNKLHISVDTRNGKIYGAGETAGQNLFIYNVITNAEETPIPLIDLDTEPKVLGKIVTNVYRNGKVYLGSESQKRIVEVDVESGEYRTLATGVPISGGDLIFDGDDLILATRAGNRIVRIEFAEDGGDAIVENIATDLPAKVNGMALTSGGDYLLANDGKNAFELYDSNGESLWSYTVTGLGEDFKFKSGDLASGCYVPATDDLCEAANVSVENGSFEDLEDWTISGGWDYVPQENVPGWSTIYRNDNLNEQGAGTIEIQETGRVNGNISSDRDQHFELNGDGLNDLYQKICTSDIDNLRVTFDHKKRQQGGDDIMIFYVLSQDEFDSYVDNPDNVDGHTIQSEYVSEKDIWETTTGVFEIPEGQNETYIVFRGIEGTTNTIGNLIDNVSVETTLLVPTSIETFATLGTTEVAVIENDIRMYPVPANNEINVTLNSNVGGKVSYEIVSIMGQSFNRGAVDAYAGETNIKADISNLADGTYFFVMNVNGNTITKQFVKMRR